MRMAEMSNASHVFTGAYDKVIFLANIFPPG
jgi:hypothetical protein